MAKSGAMIAIGAGIVLGSPNDAHRHTIEYGDQATRNIIIITIDICQEKQQHYKAYTNYSLKEYRTFKDSVKL